MADDCHKLKQLAKAWSPGLDVEQALAPVWAAFSDPARLTAALAYYRALPGDLLSADTWKLVLQPTPVPACVIYGAQDGCIAPEMFTDQAHLFAAGVRFQCIAEAGHFMQLEQPEKFAAVVLDFLHNLPPAR